MIDNILVCYPFTSVQLKFLSNMIVFDVAKNVQVWTLRKGWQLPAEQKTDRTNTE